MNIKKVLAIAVAFTALTAATVWADSLMVNHKEAKVRNGPDTTYTILWRPRLYTPMEILAKYERWYAIRDVEGDVGWIHDSVILKKKAAVVTSKLINVRKSGSDKSQILFQAPKNYTFKVLQEKKGWFKVEDPDKDVGWINKKGVWDGKTKAKKKQPAKKKKK